MFYSESCCLGPSRGLGSSLRRRHDLGLVLVLVVMLVMRMLVVGVVMLVVMLLLVVVMIIRRPTKHAL